MSRVDKTKFVVQHESYDYKCGTNESVFNSKQKWNSAECRCEYKEIDDWGSSCEKRLIGKLVLECEDEMSWW